jgi:hypothetical protein
LVNNNSNNNNSNNNEIYPQVWSQHQDGGAEPDIRSWEYKVNCANGATSHTDFCFLSDLSSVTVTDPNNNVIALDKDFNTNLFSGEVTRRWVKYGPSNGS